MTRWSLFLQTLSLLHHFLGLYYKATLALIVGAPSRVRAGVQALLLASPVIAAVELADSGLAAVKAVRNCCPALVVVIMSRSDDGIPAILRRIKAKCASSRFLVLGSDAHLESAATAAGADRFALIGTAAPQLAEIVTSLLSDTGEHSLAEL